MVTMVKRIVIAAVDEMRKLCMISSALDDVVVIDAGKDGESNDDDNDN